MIVKITDIRVEKTDDKTKRARGEFGDIFKLAASLKENGLMHPPVVNLDPTGQKLYVLIAGERRIRALIFNGETEIPVTLLDEKDDLGRKICELEENTNREDMTWQEQIEVVRQLDELKRQKFGEGTQSRDNTGWTIGDTAKSIGVSKSSAGQDIKLARDLLERPDLQKKVKKLPKHAARKIVKQTLEEEQLKRQIDRNQLTISSDLRFGSCVDLIDGIADGAIDLWLTDPPFASAHIVGTSGANSPSEGMPTYNLTASNVSNDEDMTPVYKVLIPKMYKKMKDGAHFYMFFGHSWYCRLISLLRKNGFHVDDQPLIWDKCRVSVMAKDLHYMSSYEAILFGYKLPAGRILSKPVSNVLSYPAMAHQHKTHPLQRPHDLLKLLIENSSSVGELVVDTFAGSGSTLVSAKKLQRNAIGFELDEGNFLRAQEWISKEIK